MKYHSAILVILIFVNLFDIQLSGNSIEEAIKKSMSGDNEDAYLALGKSVPPAINRQL